MKITATGPLFDGRALREADRYTDDTVTEIGEFAVDTIKDELSVVLKNPSGFYRSKITASPVKSSRVEVTDSRVVYGPWLEGVEARNKTTRFKGYATFRRMTQVVQRNVVKIGDREWKRHEPRFN